MEYVVPAKFRFFLVFFGFWFLFLYFMVVFGQSQGEGWERGSRAVVGHRWIMGQEGYTMDISISLEGL